MLFKQRDLNSQQFRSIEGVGGSGLKGPASGKFCGIHSESIFGSGSPKGKFLDKPGRETSGKQDPGGPVSLNDNPIPVNSPIAVAISSALLIIMFGLLAQETNVDSTIKSRTTIRQNPQSPPSDTLKKSHTLPAVPKWTSDSTLQFEIVVKADSSDTGKIKPDSVTAPDTGKAKPDSSKLTSDSRVQGL
ncbi:MAG: hypothetical protein V1909_02105 [Candidatus Micrarchaeota archaeon]